MLSSVETCFKVAINVYELQEDKTAKATRISNLEYKQDHVMHLNLYKDHFSYIKKFKSYAKKFTCPNCTRILNQSCHLLRHAKKCRSEVEEVYKGGKYRIKKTVFELLDALGINVPENDRFDPYFVVYDFEALQVPIDEVLQGRNLHFKHVPATVSICSNVPGHTYPVHIRSNGDSQQLVDEFVQELLKIQATRETLLTQKYQPSLDALEVKQAEIEIKMRHGKPEDEEAMEESDEDVEEYDDARVGQKRKRKGEGGKKKRVSNCRFIDDEPELSSGDSSESDDDISSDVDESNALYHHRPSTNDSQPGSSPAPQPMYSVLTGEEYEVEQKRLKRVKAFLSKLKTYIAQITILGFNSQKYDIPLIRQYLPSSIIKFDGTPKQIIKKMNGYMAISSEKMKFLDITNYLAAGTSLKDFYKSYSVSTPKGCFPYQWFDSLAKLDEPSLPRRTDELKEALARLAATEELSNAADNIEEPLSKKVEELSKDDPFYSILTKKTITNEDFQSCEQKWVEQGMKTFADYVRYYNNADVTGFVDAVNKMVAHEKLRNGLDMFKVSVSLPGLTERYLFSKLDDKVDYFVGFAEEHKYLAKLIRENIVGGPSIIFHRYQERNKTLIKGKNICKKVIGFDANSLYPYCMTKEMPTGYYTLQEEENGYRKDTRYSHESIQWLEHVIRTTGAKIRHGCNSSGEHRIGNFEVDGYDETTRTVYEYHGCYWHKHFCNTWYDAKVWSKTLEREETIRNLGYNLVSITSCEWFKMPESKTWYPPITPDLALHNSLSSSSSSTLAPEHEITKENILNDVETDRAFGIIQVDIHVPDELKPRFSEFPPIFKNTEITIADIGDHMQSYCRSINRTKGVARSLISSMHAEGILLLTPLLKWYLRMGLVVTRVHRFIGYQGKRVFRSFVQEGCSDRRRADLGGDELKMKGDAAKLKLNCSYGRTLMNKSIQTKLSFTKHKNLPIHVNNPFLKKYDELNEQIFEVEKKKKKIVYDLPTQIGLAVYSYAKLRMLEFWEFINTFLVNDLYQLMEMDTDSLYIAFARDTIDECVKPEYRGEKWINEKRKWFSAEHDDKCKIKFEDHIIPFAQWDKRTPGKFKPEFDGIGMACLNSKVYTIWSDEESKTGCKGAQQKRNQLLKEHFLTILETQQPHRVENAGFVKDKEGVIKTYTQKKVGMGYFYAKRKVLADGVSTSHLDI